MQYLVEVQGSVKNKIKKAYVVTAENENSAENIAIDNFSNEYCVDEQSVNIQSNKRNIKAIIGYIFMSIPIFLSFIQWKNGHDTISISPDYISCLYAVIIYSSFVIRFKGVQRTVSSWIDIVYCVFNVLLMSSFIRTILSSSSLNILGLFSINIDTNILLIIAIAFSWLGLKFVSLSCIAGISIFALLNISALNLAMGHIYGPIYIISSFIGILFYLSIEPALSEMTNNFKNFTQKSIYKINDDLKSAKNDVHILKEKINKIK